MSPAMKKTDQEAADVAANVVDRASRRRAMEAEPMPRWVLVFGMIAGVLLLCFVIIHLTGHGLGHHGTRSQTPQRSESNQGEQP